MAKVRPAWIPGAVDWLPDYQRDWFRPNILDSIKTMVLDLRSVLDTVRSSSYRWEITR